MKLAAGLVRYSAPRKGPALRSRAQAGRSGRTGCGKALTGKAVGDRVTLERVAEFFAIAGPAVVFAGISTGGFGSGAASAAAAILAPVVEPGLTLGVMLPLLMLIALTTLRPYWRNGTGPMPVSLFRGVPGVAPGAAFRKVADADLIRLLIGLVATGFVVWRMVEARGITGRVRDPCPTGPAGSPE